MSICLLAYVFVTVKEGKKGIKKNIPSLFTFTLTFYSTTFVNLIQVSIFDQWDESWPGTLVSTEFKMKYSVSILVISSCFKNLYIYIRKC